MSKLKKNIVVILIIAIFGLWLYFWIVNLSVILNQFAVISYYFYFGLLVPWIIIVAYVIYGRFLLGDMSRTRESGNTIQSLNIQEGMVRIFVIMFVMMIYIHYIILTLDNISVAIPTDLLIMVNMIVAYFGFTRKNVLPSGHVIEKLPTSIPKNGELLNSFPPVKNAITEFTKEYENLLNKVVDITTVTTQFTSEIINSTTEKITQLEKILKHIPNVDVAQPYKIFGSLVVVFFLVIVNVLIPESDEQIITNVAVSGLGLVVGLFGSTIMGNKIINDVKTILPQIRDNLTQLNVQLEEFANDVNTFKNQSIRVMKIWFKDFKEQNFLSFLPSNYSSLLSIGVISFLSLIIFIMPIPVPLKMIATVQWFFLYYFISKRK